MKKLFMISALAAATILMSCSASVRTKKHGASINVGSIEKVDQAEVNS
jgi:hypothetical protein